MSDQLEALRLAHELDAYHTRSCHKEAAAELRRLHEENERLNAEIESWQLTLAAALNLGEKATSENNRLQLEIEAQEALYDSAWCAGAKAGWNFCAADNMRGYQAAINNRDYLKELRQTRQVRAALRQEDTK